MYIFHANRFDRILNQLKKYFKVQIYLFHERSYKTMNNVVEANFHFLCIKINFLSIENGFFVKKLSNICEKIGQKYTRCLLLYTYFY